MIGKGIAKLGTLAKKYGRFPKAAEFKSSYANLKNKASSAKVKSMEFASKSGNKVYQNIKKNPKKYAAGAIGLAGVGVYGQHQKLKKDGTHAKLKKALQAKGYVD